jgi:hypothetical protein
VAVSEPQVFAFRYGAFRLLLSALGMGPRYSRIELDADALRVRMGWAFAATVPRQHITGAESRSGPVGGIGVHGLRGRWLVNGAASGLVTLTIEPPVRARVGVSVALAQLTLSLEDPEGFLAAVGGAA